MPVDNLLSEECLSELHRVRLLTQKLLTASPDDGVASFDDGSDLPVSSDALKTSQVLRDLGGLIDQSISSLVNAVEEQLILLYTHMKKRVDEESRLNSSTALASSQYALAHLAKGEKSIAPQSSVKVSAEMSLHSWLHIQLEAAMQATHSTRGAVYLKSIDGAAYLRRIACIEGTDVLPQDVSLASGSTLGTVVQYGVGVSVKKTRFSQEESRVQNSAALKVANCIVLPIALNESRIVGCAIVADRHGDRYTNADEQKLWAFTTAASEVMRRYDLKVFVNPKVTRDFAFLGTGSTLPPVTERKEQPSIAPESVDVPSVDSLPRPSAIQQIVRFDGGPADVSPRDVQTKDPSTLSEEDVLESAAPYVRNLEQLWKRSLDTVTELRGECGKWDSEITRKNNRIIELEIQLKALQKQFVRLRNDVAKVKSVVPKHLNEQFDKSSRSGDGEMGRSGRKKSRHLSQSQIEGLPQLQNLSHLPKKPAPNTARL